MSNCIICTKNEKKRSAMCPPCFDNIKVHKELLRLTGLADPKVVQEVRGVDWHTPHFYQWRAMNNDRIACYFIREKYKCK